MENNNTHNAKQLPIKYAPKEKRKSLCKRWKEYTRLEPLQQKKGTRGMKKIEISQCKRKIKEIKEEKKNSRETNKENI